MKVHKTKDKNTKQGIVLVYMNPEEALRLISSLSRQLMFKSSSKGREEFVTENQEYFTIFVEVPKEDPDVEEYARMKKWGMSDEKFMEYKAKIKEWKEAQENDVANETTPD